MSDVSTSCCLNHFCVIEVPDAQTYRHLKTARRTIDLKRHTNLSARLPRRAVSMRATLILSVLIPLPELPLQSRLLLY
jgi:hypothetical protein